MLILTPESIQADIAGYETRIQEAETKLSELPEGRVPYQEHKKREAKRREHLSDIEHYTRLLGYAAEALA